MVMCSRLGRFFALGVVALLAGCDEAGVLRTDTAPTALPPAAEHYAALPDGHFTVPPVPVAEVSPDMLRQEVSYPSTEATGTIIIDTAAKHLYLITGKNRALRYGIAVGRAGFAWSGEAEITGRTTWPTWTPPPEMIRRRPELARFKGGQPGGLTNPLGARALYLRTDGVDYGYRIHGTPEWDSIGQNASSGCIRMINQDVIDLYNRVPNGTRVVVLTEDGKYPTALFVPKPGAASPAAPAKPVEAVTQAAQPAHA